MLLSPITAIGLVYQAIRFKNGGETTGQWWAAWQQALIVAWLAIPDERRAALLFRCAGAQRPFHSPENVGFFGIPVDRLVNR